MVPDTEAIDVDVNKKSDIEVDARAHPKNAPVAPWFSLTKNHARGYCEAFLRATGTGTRFSTQYLDLLDGYFSRLL